MNERKKGMIEDKDKKEVILNTTQKTPKAQVIYDEEEWIRQKEEERLNEVEGNIELKEKEEKMIRLEMEWEKEKILKE
jgi:allophanate hydrolase subunit 1